MTGKLGKLSNCRVHSSTPTTHPPNQPTNQPPPRRLVCILNERENVALFHNSSNQNPAKRRGICLKLTTIGSKPNKEKKFQGKAKGRCKSLLQQHPSMPLTSQALISPWATPSRPTKENIQVFYPTVFVLLLQQVSQGFFF